MKNFTDDDYRKIGRCLKRIMNNNSEDDLEEIHSMFEPLINKHSYNLLTNTFSDELNNELNSKMYELIMNFKI